MSRQLLQVEHKGRWSNCWTSHNEPLPYWGVWWAHPGYEMNRLSFCRRCLVRPYCAVKGVVWGRGWEGVSAYIIHGPLLWGLTKSRCKWGLKKSSQASSFCSNPAATPGGRCQQPQLFELCEWSKAWERSKLGLSRSYEDQGQAPAPDFQMCELVRFSVSKRGVLWLI